MALSAQSSFNFSELCENFAKICPDFLAPQSEKHQSLDFAKRVLFELGPKMRDIKKSGTNGEMWRLMFADGSSVFIYSYSFKKPMNVNPRLRDKQLYMTLKQADLLAVSKLCSVLPAQHKPSDKVLLTPLARVVFAPQNISQIASELTTLLGRNVDRGDVVKAVISSCQTDGFHLEHSQCHIALVAIEVTVRGAVKREKLRSKVQRLYAKHGKNFDNDQYKIYLKYSKVNNRPPDDDAEEPEPRSSTPPPVKSIDSVLRSIARTIDDPLSGGTLDLNFISAPSTAPPLQETDVTLPTPIEFSIEATNLQEIRSVQMPSRLIDPEFQPFLFSL